MADINLNLDILLVISFVLGDNIRYQEFLNLKMYLSRRDEDDLLYMIDKAVYKFLGNEDNALAKSALNCIVKSYDRRKTESMALFV